MNEPQQWVDVGAAEDFKRARADRAQRGRAKCLLEREIAHSSIERGGRKASA